ncbi:hypothetical protein [Serratia sp. Se-RSBMAAmG]|uniref:hypothetical protein n=1 Tax=Serratia sp. Se-RSBMAAmG TaxID=3043305 RepID=UPI0024AED003|nr:hypothetical protein [Serratia sp. Se-RSBMAAmG]MDI6976272.1 hypothetical protein [Serratia sp. Se-RSBMAAmG]
MKIRKPNNDQDFSTLKVLAFGQDADILTGDLYDDRRVEIALAKLSQEEIESVLVCAREMVELNESLLASPVCDVIHIEYIKDHEMTLGTFLETIIFACEKGLVMPS